MLSEFTVIIPARDRHDKVKRALRSISAQSHLPKEVILVDDGSVPPLQVEDQELPVRVLRHPRSLGPAAARNTGMTECRTPWVTFLDSDDFLLDGSYEARCGQIDQDDSLTIHGCAWQVVDAETGEPLRIEYPQPAESVLDHYSGIWFSPGSCIFMNIDRAIRDVGLMDPALLRYEDFEWFCRLAERGFVLKTSTQVGVCIERHRTVSVTTAKQSAERLLEGAAERKLYGKKFKRLQAYAAFELAAAHGHAGHYFRSLYHLLRSIWHCPRLSINPLPESRHVVPADTRWSGETQGFSGPGRPNSMP